MNKLFSLKENNTTIGTEVYAGLTTFFAMAYIIFLNPVYLSSTGMDPDGVMIATCLSAAFGTLLCAFLSNRPFAMASGMGLNAFFAYTLCGAYGYSWQQALALTFLAGIIFLIIAASPLRDKVIRAIPSNMKYAITAGIGLFLATVGLLDSGIITMQAGFPALGDFHNRSVLIALIGLAATIVLLVLHVKGSLMTGMLLTVLAGIFMGVTPLPKGIIGFPNAISTVFLKMDFHGLAQGKTGIQALFALAALLLSLTMVDMFDTLGFLIGAGSRMKIMDRDGNMPGMGRVMLADAASTIFGAACGTSTVTCYAESAAGISAGGKTGLTSLTTGVCFLLAIVFAPLTSVVTAAATAPVMIIIGMYLFMEIKNLQFEHMDDAIPAFLTLIAMPLAYSITTGIGAGFISYVLCKLVSGKRKEINPAIAILAVIFLIYFIL